MSIYFVIKIRNHNFISESAIYCLMLTTLTVLTPPPMASVQCFIDGGNPFFLYLFIFSFLGINKYSFYYLLSIKNYLLTIFYKSTPIF